MSLPPATTVPTKTPIVGGHPFFPMRDPNYMDISLIEDPEKLPDVIGGMAFGEYLGKEFLSRYVNQHAFTPVPYQTPLHPLFRGLELQDSTGSFHIYGACAFTMLVDRRKLNGRPVPRSWAEVLDPCYENMVVCGFNIDDINEIFLIYFQYLFGDDGLRAFSRNLCRPVDTLDMMRVSLHRENTHAIFLLPHFFAEAAPKEDYMELVWPEEGAMLCPLYYLARNTDSEKVRAILSFLTGPKLGKALAEKHFFHINPQAVTAYDNRKFLWAGWDWFTKTSIVSRMREIDRIITPLVLEKCPDLQKTIGRNLWNG
ncbi:MAG: ABC transporter substrate-binding protein [Oscillospiraceae bacterium]|nr:ABC transporter substrate-binding protein [Oscillospiraceae bacterium]